VPPGGDFPGRLLQMVEGLHGGRETAARWRYRTDEVKDLRREARDLKEVVAEQTLELRLLKKSMFDGGGDHE